MYAYIVCQQLKILVATLPETNDIYLYHPHNFTRSYLEM